MKPSATPYLTTEIASARDSGQRQGRQSASSSKAEKPTRKAVVPMEPTCGKSCLANEVPIAKAVTEPKTASMGSAFANRVEVIREESFSGGAYTRGVSTNRHKDSAGSVTLCIIAASPLNRTAGPGRD